MAAPDPFDAAHSENAWALDMFRRLGPRSGISSVPLVAALVVGAALSNWWAGLAIAGYVACFLVGIELAQRLGRLEPIIVGWLLGQTFLMVAIALERGGRSPEVALLVVALVAASMTNTRRVFAVCCGYTLLLVAVLVVGTASNTVAPGPLTLVAPLAVVMSLWMFGSIGRRASLEFRGAAVLDPLTGLLNRASLEIRAQELEQQAALTNRPVGVALFDVDHFKNINDTHGHTAGDQVLTEIAYLLRKELRAFDLAYRIGGEEILILLPDVDLVEAQAVAERVRQSIRSVEISGVRATISTGVAVSAPGEFVYAEAFAAADAALYRAKQTGRDRVVTAPPRDAQDVVVPDVEHALAA